MEGLRGHNDCLIKTMAVISEPALGQAARRASPLEACPAELR